MMKKIFFLILFFCKIQVFSQFEKIIEYPINKYMGALLIETEDNAYIIKTTDYLGYSHLLKFSVNGTLTDSISLLSFFDENIINDNNYDINFTGDMIFSDNNEILITGCVYEEALLEDSLYDFVKFSPFILKIDENFNFLSSDTIDLPKSFPFNSFEDFQGLFLINILQMPTTNFFAFTYKTIISKYGLYELTDNFDTLQFKVLSTQEFFPPLFLNNYNDSSLYLFFRSSVFGIKKDFTINFIKNINEDLINEEINISINKLLTVKHLNNNRILMYFGCDVLISPTYPFEFNEQVGIYIVDTLFNLHNYTHLGYSMDTLDAPVYRRNGIDFKNQNNIFVVGVVNNCEYSFTGKENEITSIMLSVLDSNLNIKHQCFYGGDASYMPSDIKATSDGGCLIVSSKYEINSGNDYSYVHLLKVNENGELSPPISNEEINNSTMKLAFIYPNPSKDFINVRYGAHLKNVSIEIFDISGKKILFKNLEKSVSRIDIQNLKIGSYVYHILNDNKIIEKEILIKK